MLILACSAVLIAPLNAFLPGSPTAARVRASGTARGSTCFCHQLRCTSGEKPRTVGIIGGGPAGLVTALALLKLPTGVEQVTIFEQKSSGNLPSAFPHGMVQSYCMHACHRHTRTHTHTHTHTDTHRHI